MSSIVIIGAGIIGCSTAYYLTETAGIEASDIHLVEAAPEFFASASGKAAGFLAADWFGPEVLPLGELSFKLHKELADKYDGRSKWGYSPSNGVSYIEPEGRLAKEAAHDWLMQGSSRAGAAGQHEFREGDGPAWLARRHGDSVEILSQDGTTAQVDPLRLCEFLLKECRRRGVVIHQSATVAKVTMDQEGRPSLAQIKLADGELAEVSCSRILFSAGAWTKREFERLFPTSTLQLPISQLAGHSLVIHSPRWMKEHEDKGCHAVFSTMRSGLSPEIMGRLGGEIYVAGLNSTTIPLPDLPTDAVIDSASIAELLAVGRKLLGSGTDTDDLEIGREGLCFRPVTPSGQPIVSKVPEKYMVKDKVAPFEELGGVFVAAGHGPWGIALSLGTGKVMSELLLVHKTSADIHGLAL